MTEDVKNEAENQSRIVDLNYLRDRATAEQLRGFVAIVASGQKTVSPPSKKKGKKGTKSSPEFKPLKGWPKKALIHHGGRATLAQIVKFMQDNEAGYLLVKGREEEHVRASLNKNKNRAYQEFPDGSWGLIRKPKLVAKAG